MNPRRRFLGATLRYLLVVVCTITIVPGDTLTSMPSPRSMQAAAPQDQAAKIPPEQLDSLLLRPLPFIQTRCSPRPSRLPRILSK